MPFGFPNKLVIVSTENQKSIDYERSRSSRRDLYAVSTVGSQGEWRDNIGKVMQVYDRARVTLKPSLRFDQWNHSNPDNPYSTKQFLAYSLTSCIDKKDRL